mgnify:CR=1 FL=1
MKDRAYHEAGHTIAARELGMPVELTTIEESVNLQFATKSLRLKDCFDEDELLLGSLRRKDGYPLRRRDYRLFYSILIVKVAGYIAVLKAGYRTYETHSHYEEDRALALNVLNHLKGERANRYYERIWAIAERILTARWNDVADLAQRLIEEKTIHFDESVDTSMEADVG